MPNGEVDSCVVSCAQPMWTNRNWSELFIRNPGSHGGELLSFWHYGRRATLKFIAKTKFLEENKKGAISYS